MNDVPQEPDAPIAKPPTLASRANTIAATLRAAGRELPLPIAAAIDRGADLPMPFAIGTREALAPWCERNGYGTVEAAQLRELLRIVVLSNNYLAGLAADDSRRHDLDGNVVEPVSDEARLAAALLLFSRKISFGNKVTDPPRKPDGVSTAKHVATHIAKPLRPILGLPKDPPPPERRVNNQPGRKDR